MRVYLNVKILDWELLQGPWVNGLKCRATLSGRLGSPGPKGTTKSLCIGHLFPLHTSMSSALLPPQRVPRPLRGPASVLPFHQAYSPKNFEALTIVRHRQNGSQTKTVSKNFLERGDIIVPGTWHASLSRFGGVRMHLCFDSFIFRYNWYKTNCVYLKYTIWWVLTCVYLVKPSPQSR